MSDTSASRAGFAPRDLLLALPAVGAGLAVARSHRGLGLALGSVAVVGVVARLAFGPRVHEPIVRLVVVAERVLTWLGVALLWLVIVLPGAVAHRVGSVGRRRSDPAGGWVTSPPTARTTRAFATPTASERSRGSFVLRAIGLVVVLLAVDVGIGAAWIRVTRSEVAVSAGVGRDGTFHDPRADSPALAPDPWADEHLRLMQRLPQAFWPFTMNRPVSIDTPTVKVDGWVRSSYEPEGNGDDLPVVAFFGGSTTFGEGQRDDHTIPSEIARLAEQAGTPIRVVNYGQRSWVAWQELVLFDQIAADGVASAPPDLVVFYDGANEVAQQGVASTAGWPTIFNVDRVGWRLTGEPAGSSEATGTTSRSLGSEVADWYRGRSMAFRIARWARGALGAAPTPEVPARRSDVVQVGRDAAAVYLRALDIISATAQRREIPVSFYWQPVPNRRGDPSFMEATRLVEGSVIDISDALDDRQDVYFDQVHTNEAGARLVAERMWETLGPQVADAS